MDVDASPEPQAVLETMTDLPGAPQGWHKKLLPKKTHTLRRRDVIFIAPTGEEIRSKSRLERYLKAHPGGPALSDFVWSAGDSPRKSERLIAKTRLSIESADLELSEKKPKRGTPESQSENEKAKKGRTGMKEPMEVSKEDGDIVILEEDPVNDLNEAGKVFEEGLVNKDEHLDTIPPKETLFKSATSDNKDFEMKDSVHGTDIPKSTVMVVDNESKPKKESIVEVQDGEKSGEKMQQEVLLQAAVIDGAKGTDKVVDSTECKKDDSLGNFIAAEAHTSNERTGDLHSETDIGQSQLTPYYGVAKPQEAHPAEVDVSS